VRQVGGSRDGSLDSLAPGESFEQTGCQKVWAGGDFQLHVQVITVRTADRLSPGGGVLRPGHVLYGVCVQGARSTCIGIFFI
jgi:hypothetical protein